MEIKTRKLFKELVKKLTMELLDEESIEEITTTAAVPGYLTPFAFSDKSEKDKKKRLKKIKMQEALKSINKFCGIEDKSNVVKDEYVIQTMRYLELVKELK